MVWSAGHAPTSGSIYKFAVLYNSKLYHAHQFRDGKKQALTSAMACVGMTVSGKMKHSPRNSKDPRVGSCEACRLGSTCVFPSGIGSVHCSFIQNWKDAEANLAAERPVHLSAAEDFQHFNLFHSKHLCADQFFSSTSF